jgi:hypothetical protein
MQLYSQAFQVLPRQEVPQPEELQQRAAQGEQQQRLQEEQE